MGSRFNVISKFVGVSIAAMMTVGVYAADKAPAKGAADAAKKFPAADPEVILQKADDIRSPSRSYAMIVDVNNSEGGDVFSYDVSSKGRDKTLIKTLKPSRDKGRNYLMLKDEMWAYIPNLKRAVRVSLNQKLTGQAANGDIARMRWSGDYKPVIESETDKEWQLFMIANRTGLTYEKMRLWVEKSSHRPLRAEFLTVSGTVLKKATFGGWKEMEGTVRPTEIKHTDVKTGAFSTLNIQSIQGKDFADSLFDQSSLK